MDYRICVSIAAAFDDAPDRGIRILHRADALQPVATALCARADRSRMIDHPQTLITAIAGEKSKYGVAVIVR